MPLLLTEQNKSVNKKLFEDLDLLLRRSNTEYGEKNIVEAQDYTPLQDEPLLLGFPNEECIKERLLEDIKIYNEKGFCFILPVLEHFMFYAYTTQERLHHY